MSFPWVWAELGLEKTGDVGAIRRAYAARLKLTNPEDDGDGFQKLRTAYDHAMAYARRAPRPAPAEAPTDETPKVARLEATVAPQDAPETQAAPQLVEPTAPAEETPAPAEPPPHVVKLWRLQGALRPGTSPEQMLAALNDLLGDPEMDDLGVALGVERALADLIASHVPLSDPLIAPAVARFGWSETAQLRPGAEATAFILRRAVELEVERNMARLRTFLTQGPAAADAASQALADLLNSRAMHDVGVYGRVEGWVAQLILDRAPNADFLIEPAARRFQWRRQATNPPVVAAVLQRMRPRDRTASRGPGLLSKLGLSTGWSWKWRMVAVALFIISGLFRSMSHGDDPRSGPAPLPTPTPVTAPAPMPGWSKGFAVLGCHVAPDGGIKNCKIESERAAAPGFGKAALSLTPQVRLRLSPYVSARELERLKVRLKVAFDPANGAGPQVTLVPPLPKVKIPASPQAALAPSPPPFIPRTPPAPQWSDPNVALQKALSSHGVAEPFDPTKLQQTPPAPGRAAPSTTGPSQPSSWN